MPDEQRLVRSYKIIYLFGMFTIRKVTTDDVEALSDLAAKTFSETFAQHNTPEDMHAFISSAFSVEQLASEILSSQYHFILVDGTPAGYLQLKFDTTEKGLEGVTAVEIARIYVAQQFFGRGLGSALMETAISIARQHRADYVWLGVWENNFRARKFYAKWGFEEFGSHPFQLGNDRQTDLLMKKHIHVTRTSYEYTSAKRP